MYSLFFYINLVYLYIFIYWYGGMSQSMRGTQTNECTSVTRRYTLPCWGWEILPGCCSGESCSCYLMLVFACLAARVTLVSCCHYYIIHLQKCCCQLATQNLKGQHLRGYAFRHEVPHHFNEFHDTLRKQWMRRTWNPWNPCVPQRLTQPCPRPSLVREGRFLGTVAVRGRGSLLCPAWGWWLMEVLAYCWVAFGWMFTLKFWINLV